MARTGSHGTWGLSTDWLVLVTAKSGLGFQPVVQALVGLVMGPLAAAAAGDCQPFPSLSPLQ